MSSDNMKPEVGSSRGTSPVCDGAPGLWQFAAWAGLLRDLRDLRDTPSCTSRVLLKGIDSLRTRGLSGRLDMRSRTSGCDPPKANCNPPAAPPPPSSLRVIRIKRDEWFTVVYHLCKLILWHRCLSFVLIIYQLNASAHVKMFYNFRVIDQ